jgi:predicted permease
VSALVNTAFKMLAQPAVMLLLAVLLGVTGVSRREMILLSTILSLVTLGVCIAMTA